MVTETIELPESIDTERLQGVTGAWTVWAGTATFIFKCMSIDGLMISLQSHIPRPQETALSRFVRLETAVPVLKIEVLDDIREPSEKCSIEIIVVKLYRILLEPVKVRRHP